MAVDVNEQDRRDDARAFLRSCRQLTVPAVLAMLAISCFRERSHAWVLLERAVPAREACQQVA